MSNDNDIVYSCFTCKHCIWKYREDFPVIEYLYCNLGHEATWYNTKQDKFECKDYTHSYFVKAYTGYWFYGIIGIILLMCILKALNVI